MVVSLKGYKVELKRLLNLDLNHFNCNGLKKIFHVVFSPLIC